MIGVFGELGWVRAEARLLPRLRVAMRVLAGALDVEIAKKLTELLRRGRR